jgi:hypothetical protein
MGRKGFDAPQTNQYINQTGRPFQKTLNWALFHWHANFLLGHVPLIYFPFHHTIFGTYTDQAVAIEHVVPDSFTTPICATAARVHAPLPEDYVGNP